MLHIPTFVVMIYKLWTLYSLKDFRIFFLLVSLSNYFIHSCDSIVLQFLLLLLDTNFTQMLHSVYSLCEIEIFESKS